MKIKIFYTLFFLSGPLFINTGTKKYDPAYCVASSYKLLCSQPGFIDEVLFTPFDEVKRTLLGLIHAEQRAIFGALYRVTDADIAQALIQAKKRGVRITLIVDSGAVTSAYQKISNLKKAGITIRVYYRGLYSILHHKFFIFEKNLKGRSIVWHGSANATVGGMIRNQECVHIFNKPSTVLKFKKLFDNLAKLPVVTLLKRRKKFWLL